MPIPPVTPLACYAASIAPGCAAPRFRPARLPPQAPADWLRGFAQRLTLRFRPHSATAPFAPNSGAKGLRLRAGCACRTQAPPDAAQPALWLRLMWFPFVAACAEPLTSSASLSLPRPRTALRFPARACPRLRSMPGAAYPAMFGGRQFNIMLGIMRNTPLRSVLSGSRPHNLHYV